MAEDKKNQDSASEEPKGSNEQNAGTTQSEKSNEPEKDIDTSKSDSKQEEKQRKEDYVPKQHFDSVKGDLEAKNKKLQELENEVNKIKIRDQVKDLLLESDYPPIIKKKLKDRLDSLTPDNFEDSAKELVDIFEFGRESYKNEQIENVNKKPEKMPTKDVYTKIENAESIDDLEELWSN